MNIIKKPSPHFASRSENPIKYICVHIMGGTLFGTDEWFANPKSKVSSNYGIGMGGEIHQYVDEKKMAFGNGVVLKPTAQIVKDNLGTNQNKISVSIECEGYDLAKAPESQLDVLAALINDIATRNNIPIDRFHIIGHREIDLTTRPTCPSFDNSAMDNLVQRCLKLKVAENNINNLNNKNMINWVKFYTTGVAEYQTYHTGSKVLQNDGETHAFTDATDAVLKSTSEVFIFWDNQPIGPGAQAA